MPDDGTLRLEWPRWRDRLAIHPACLAFDDLPRAELEALAADIGKHTLRQPVVFLKSADGQMQLLDGKNRLDAIELLGQHVIKPDGALTISYETIEATKDFDPKAYVESANDKRRHNTPAARRKALERAERAVLEHPERSDRAIAKEAGVSAPTVAKARRAPTVKTLQLAEPEKRVGADGKARRQPARKPKAELSTKPEPGPASPASAATVEPGPFNLMFESRAAEFRRLMLLGMRDVPFADWQPFIARLIEEAEDVRRNFDRLRVEMQEAGKCE